MSLEITGGKRIMSNLGKLSLKGHNLAAKGLYQEGLQIERAAKIAAPVFDNTLRGSGHTQLPKWDRDGVEVVVGFGGAAKGYAVGVHEGTGPAVGRPKYFPPIDALKRWAKKKLGDEGLAFVVARKIYNEGTKPTKFLQNAIVLRTFNMNARLARFIKAGLRI